MKACLGLLSLILTSSLAWSASPQDAIQQGAINEALKHTCRAAIATIQNDVRSPRIVGMARLNDARKLGLEKLETALTALKPDTRQAILAAAGTERGTQYAKASANAQALIRRDLGESLQTFTMKSSPYCPPDQLLGAQLSADGKTCATKQTSVPASARPMQTAQLALDSNRNDGLTLKVVAWTKEGSDPALSDTYLYDLKSWAIKPMPVKAAEPLREKTRAEQIIAHRDFPPMCANTPELLPQIRAEMSSLQKAKADMSPQAYEREEATRREAFKSFGAL